MKGMRSGRPGNSEPVVIAGNSDLPRNKSRSDSCGSPTVTCPPAEIGGKHASKSWSDNCALCRPLLSTPRRTLRRSAAFWGARSSLGRGPLGSPSPGGATDYTRRVVLRQRASLPPAVGPLVSDLGLCRSHQLSRCGLDLLLPPRCRGGSGPLCRDHPPLAVAPRVVSAAATRAALFRLGVPGRSDHPVGGAQVSGDPGRAPVRLTPERLQPRSSRGAGALCGGVVALRRRDGRGAPGHA